MGDLNFVLGAHLKTSLTLLAISCREFKEAIEVMGLVSIDTLRSFYTWARRGLRSFVEYRLHRAFYWTGCVDVWRKITSLVLTRHQLDHNPNLLKFVSEFPTSTRPFWFQVMWTDHENFFHMVDKA